VPRTLTDRAGDRRAPRSARAEDTQGVGPPEAKVLVLKVDIAKKEDLPISPRSRRAAEARNMFMISATVGDGVRIEETPVERDA
jgi:hypothetical protein